MHATTMFNLTAAAAPVIASPTGYSLYSNLDGGFGEASRRTATHQMPYGLRTHRLIREVESTSCSENTWWERVDRRPEHGPASRRSLDSSVFRILKQDNLENDDENHGRRGNFLDDFFRFDSHTNSHPGQPSRLDKENKGDSNLSSQSGSARPGNPIPVPSNIDATQFEPNYNIPLEQIEHEFMVLSGGFTDTDWSSFPVWAFDMDLTSKNQWIDLSGLNVGHAFNENREDPTEHLIWPDGRVGHISAIHDGYLHVFGGLLWKDKAFVVEKVPYIWKTKIGDKLNVVLSDASSSSPHNKSVLEWERIMPKIRTYNSSNKNGTRHGSFSSGEHDKDPAQSDHTLTRGECRGGHWAGGSGLVFYGGLHVQHQLSGHEHENKEDIALGDVWMYNYTSETLEQLSPYPPPKSQRDEDGRYPIARTAHAATIVGNKLYIYGGMTSSAWSPTRGNGDGVWDELSDLWIFDLIERKWSERIMTPYLSRSYHSMVGWGDDSLAVFGGFRTAQTISGEPVAFVFSDTLISKPKNDMDSNLHQWWKVECNDAKGGLPHYEEGASNRLEHTASVDKFGNMLLFGGRFKSVSQVTGMWSINIFGQNSDLSLTPATPDGLEAYEAELEALHMLVAVMMLMSILFTALYGTLRQQAAQHEGGGGGGLGILSRRNGLSREAIDALPTKMYGESDTDDSAQPPESAADNVSDTSGLSDVPLEEEECCPICLVEYEQGDELRCLPCNHEFHRTCVDSWLEHHTSCPACRHALSNTVPEPATQENTTTSDGIWRFDYSMEPLGMTTGLSLGQLLTTRNHSGFRRAVHPGQQGAENSGEVSPDDHDDTFHDEDAAEDSSQRRPFRLRRYLRLPFTPSDAADDTLGDTELTTIPNNSAA